MRLTPRVLVLGWLLPRMEPAAKAVETVRSGGTNQRVLLLQIRTDVLLSTCWDLALRHQNTAPRNATAYFSPRIPLHCLPSHAPPDAWPAPPRPCAQLPCRCPAAASSYCPIRLCCWTWGPGHRPQRS